jgi:hypothetical protein
MTTVDWHELVALYGLENGPSPSPVSYVRGWSRTMPLGKAVQRIVDETLTTAFIVRDSDSLVLGYRAVCELAKELPPA